MRDRVSVTCKCGRGGAGVWHGAPKGRRGVFDVFGGGSRFGAVPVSGSLIALRAMRDALVSASSADNKRPKKMVRVASAVSGGEVARLETGHNVRTPAGAQGRWREDSAQLHAP